MIVYFLQKKSCTAQIYNYFVQYALQIEEKLVILPLQSTIAINENNYSEPTQRT